MTITKREILFSVIIAFVLLGLGLIINNLIIENILLYEEKINKSLKIDNDEEKFKYAMLTNVGNVLVYGEFKAIDTVSLPELKNDYMSIYKITEKYTRHSRQVCTTHNEKTTCHTEYYYDWDVISRDSYNSKIVSFLNSKFEYDKFENYQEYRLSLEGNISSNYNEYIYYDYLYEKKKNFWNDEVGDKRYYYYVSSKQFNGTIFVKANNNNINGIDSNKIKIYNSNLKTTIEEIKVQSKIVRIIFWVIWIILIGLAIYGFMYLENDWLEDRRI